MMGLGKSSIYINMGHFKGMYASNFWGVFFSPYVIYSNFLQKPLQGMILLVVLNACQCLAIIGFVDVSWPPQVEAWAFPTGKITRGLVDLPGCRLDT